jgi:hypothetical protein
MVFWGAFAGLNVGRFAYDMHFIIDFITRLT